MSIYIRFKNVQNYIVVFQNAYLDKNNKVRAVIAVGFPCGQQGLRTKTSLSDLQHSIS